VLDPRVRGQPDRSLAPHMSTHEVEIALAVPANCCLLGYRYASNGERHFERSASGVWSELADTPIWLAEVPHLHHSSGLDLVPFCH
jgi:hypothetical protein